jgi:hypothetical protein
MAGVLAMLPAELALKVAVYMGADATVEAWMDVERSSAGGRTEFRMLFGEWLSKRAVGGRFSVFAGSEKEVRFVASHAEGMWRGGALMVGLTCRKCWRSATVLLYWRCGVQD